MTNASPVVDEAPLCLDPDYEPALKSTDDSSDEASDEPAAKSTPKKSRKHQKARRTPVKAKSLKRTAWSMDMFPWVKPKSAGFCARDVIRMAREGEIELICKICKVMDIAALYDNDISVYKAGMPSWQSRGHARGLLGWGEKRVKGRTVVKKGALPELNRSCVMKAIEKYYVCVGIPPVVAGTHDMCPRHTPTTCAHDIHPRHEPTTCIHMYPRHDSQVRRQRELPN